MWFCKDVQRANLDRQAGASSQGSECCGHFPVQASARCWDWLCSIPSWGTYTSTVHIQPSFWAVCSHALTVWNLSYWWMYFGNIFVPLFLFFFLFLLMLRNEIEDSLFPSALQQFLVYLTTYCIYSPVTLISSFILCRSWLLVLALLSLFCGWTAYVLECSTKTWMLYCVWNLPSTKWDCFTCLTYDTPVYTSQFDICPFCNSMTLLTHVLLLIHCNPRCFLAELLCNQLSPSYIWTADYASVTTLHWFILNCILFFQTISAICQDHSVLQCCLQRLLPFPLARYHLQISCKIFSVPPS